MITKVVHYKIDCSAITFLKCIKLQKPRNTYAAQNMALTGQEVTRPRKLNIESSRHQRESGVYAHFCGVNSHSISVEEPDGENVPGELHPEDRVNPMPLTGYRGVRLDL